MNMPTPTGTAASAALAAWARHAASANGFGEASVRTANHSSSRRAFMQAMPHVDGSKRYARAVEVSKRVRWDIDAT